MPRINIKVSDEVWDAANELAGDELDLTVVVQQAVAERLKSILMEKLTDNAEDVVPRLLQKLLVVEAAPVAKRGRSASKQHVQRDSDIRQMAQEGKTLKDIAQHFGISTGRVSQIVNA